MLEEITDAIYEAAVDPHLWPAACDRVAALVDAAYFAISSISSTFGHVRMISPAYLAEMEAFLVSGLAGSNERIRRHVARQPFAFLRDIDVLSEAEIEVDPIYLQITQHLGLKWSMGEVIAEPSGQTLVFDLSRQTEKGPFQKDHLALMNSLRGDLARAFFLTARLARKEAETITAALSALKLAAAVIGDDGRVLAANAEYEGLDARFRIGAFDRPAFKDAATQALLMSCLEALSTQAGPGVLSIPIPGTPGNTPYVLHIAPVRRSARDLFGRSRALIIAVPVGKVGEPDLNVLSGLFDLTGSEARVAREIAKGFSPADAGRNLGLTLESVRTYLKRVYLKTGVTRQSDLVRLLSGLTF
ncbi:helix-turn-helix transcriptional regulator [Rhizobium sp. SG2393]|uniref:helix-turn-helix transcriptional regulator n=1 Tax=Rhizobium sp. SG2393 TaxID=3276279 RepID=UPI0036721C44